MPLSCNIYSSQREGHLCIMHHARSGESAFDVAGAEKPTVAGMLLRQPMHIALMSCVSCRLTACDRKPSAMFKIHDRVGSVILSCS